MSAIDSYAQYTCLAKDGSEVLVVAPHATATCAQVARLAAVKCGKAISMVLDESPVPQNTSAKALAKEWARSKEVLADDEETGVELLPSPSVFDDRLDGEPHKRSAKRMALDLKGKPSGLVMSIVLPAGVAERATKAAEEAEASGQDAEYLAVEEEIRAEEEFEAQDKLVDEAAGRQIAKALSVASSKGTIVEISAREFRARDLQLRVADDSKPSVVKPLLLERMRLAAARDLSAVGGDRASRELKDDKLVLALVGALRVARMSFAHIEMALGLRQCRGMTAYRLCKRIGKGSPAVEDLARLCAESE